MFRTAILGAMLFASSAHAATDTIVSVDTVAQFFDAYDKSDNATVRSALELMIVGAQQAIMSANAEVTYKTKNPMFCEPENTALTTPQIIHLLRIGFNEDKRYADVPVGFGLLMAYEEAFPCSK